ncbi:uncharacterized protein LOC112681478 [Sipha flava]|uniref:Uncharacterized protein LOC112681478 n=1 Tax=Sipha flava TaxID=143950 RepID=A0A8B8FB00_9HEMI|nr:uncharacterized protein LOC112681478 [Sipha flava]
MDRSYLDVNEPYVNEAPIQEMFLHSFLPFSTTAINKGDEIRIPIQNRDAVTLPSESFIYVEGKLIKPADLLTEVTFSQNGLINLFNEIKYEINSVEIQRVKRPGVSSSLKGYCSYTPEDVNCLQNAIWDGEDSNRKFIKDGSFTGCIPLKHVLGFAEDYNKVLINCSQQLILNRATDDLGSLTFFLKGNEVLSDVIVQAKVKKIKIELTKVMWKVPVVKVNDREKNWELCEYPNIPQTRKRSWMVKTCSRVEKPRCLIIAFLCKDSSHMAEEFASDFDACSLTNVKA